MIEPCYIMTHVRPFTYEVRRLPAKGVIPHAGKVIGNVFMGRWPDGQTGYTCSHSDERFETKEQAAEALIAP